MIVMPQFGASFEAEDGLGLHRTDVDSGRWRSPSTGGIRAVSSQTGRKSSTIACWKEHCSYCVIRMESFCKRRRPVCPVPYAKWFATVIHWLSQCLTFAQVSALYAIIKSTLMQIKKPSQFDDTCYCYKHIMAIIILGCVDAWGIFLTEAQSPHFWILTTEQLTAQKQNIEYSKSLLEDQALLVTLTVHSTLLQYTL